MPHPARRYAVGRDDLIPPQSRLRRAKTETRVILSERKPLALSS